MQEGTVMEFCKWIIALVIFAMLVSAVIFFCQVGSVNSFKQQVNYQIERQGGLTDIAISNINEYSNKYCHGIFTVESDRLNEKVDYGEVVDYVVNGKFDIKIFPLPDVNLKFKGTGVSQVR